MSEQGKFSVHERKPSAPYEILAYFIAFDAPKDGSRPTIFIRQNGKGAIECKDNWSLDYFAKRYKSKGHAQNFADRLNSSL